MIYHMWTTETNLKKCCLNHCLGGWLIEVFELCASITTDADRKAEAAETPVSAATIVDKWDLCVLHSAYLWILHVCFIETIDTGFGSLGYSSKQRFALCEHAKLTSNCRPEHITYHYLFVSCSQPIASSSLMVRTQQINISARHTSFMLLPVPTTHAPSLTTAPPMLVKA